MSKMLDRNEEAVTDQRALLDSTLRLFVGRAGLVQGLNYEGITSELDEETKDRNNRLAYIYYDVKSLISPEDFLRLVALSNEISIIDSFVNEDSGEVASMRENAASIERNARAQMMHDIVSSYGIKYELYSNRVWKD